MAFGSGNPAASASPNQPRMRERVGGGIGFVQAGEP